MQSVATLGVFAFALLSEASALASGGAFFPPGAARTASHTVVLSVSASQTTLWDSMTVTGAPSSFAWILPTKGTVTVGLSSNALLRTLDANSTVEPRAPSICMPAPGCAAPSDAGTQNDAGDAGEARDGSDGAASGPVIVLAQETIGPYETVQLASTDPSALTTWLTANGYVIPAGAQPTLSAYVSEGWNFLAVKFVPGANQDVMRPIRVTSPGSNPVLPLRMLRAGAGSSAPIQLFVFGAGRYEPTGTPSFTIDPTKLVYDWSRQSSNYAQLVSAGFAAAQGATWLVEEAAPFDVDALGDGMTNLATTQPLKSGYADPSGNGALEAATEDLASLVGSLPAPVWMTRLRADLPLDALASDLTLGASASQAIIARAPVVEQTTGTPPPCPACDAGPAPDGSVDAPADSGTNAEAPSNGSAVDDSGCGCTTVGDEVGNVRWSAWGLVIACGLFARRWRRRRTSP